MNDLDKIKQTRYQGLVEQIEFYSNLDKLSDVQIKQLKEVRDTIVTFGENGVKWARLADEILKDNGYNDDTMSLYENKIRINESQLRSIIKCSINKCLNEML